MSLHRIDFSWVKSQEQRVGGGTYQYPLVCSQYTVGIPKARKELAIFDFAKLFILWQSKFGLG